MLFPYKLVSQFECFLYMPIIFQLAVVLGRACRVSEAVCGPSVVYPCDICPKFDFLNENVYINFVITRTCTPL